MKNSDGQELEQCGLDVLKSLRKANSSSVELEALLPRRA